MDRRFPLGPFTAPDRITAGQREEWIEQIAALPAELRALVEGRGDEEMARRYRDGGWTARQVVHHLADSHLSATLRFKWALTEDRPTIKPYDEKAFAGLPDGDGAPLELSLDFLQAQHARWAYLLRHLGESDWQREFFHPESQEWVPLDRQAGIYAWHGRHHLAHVQLALDD